MSNLSRFLAKNKIKRENGKYAPSKAFVDENGNPLEFEFRPITSKRNEAIRESHTKEVPVTGNQICSVQNWIRQHTSII